MRSIKLVEMDGYAKKIAYTHAKSGDSVEAFQVNWPHLGDRPEPGDRKPTPLRVILPEYRDAGGLLLGEGGSISPFDGEWLVKRGDVWNVVTEEAFASEYK